MQSHVSSRVTRVKYYIRTVDRPVVVRFVITPARLTHSSFLSVIIPSISPNPPALSCNSNVLLSKALVV